MTTPADPSGPDHDPVAPQPTQRSAASWADQRRRTDGLDRTCNPRWLGPIAERRARREAARGLEELEAWLARRR